MSWFEEKKSVIMVWRIIDNCVSGRRYGHRAVIQQSIGLGIGLHAEEGGNCRRDR